MGACRAGRSGRPDCGVPWWVLSSLPTALAVLAAPGKVLKGVSYGPAPLKVTGTLASDDFMAASAAALWAHDGRHDLQIMRQLGANAVRLYGNNPKMSHKAFLDEAHMEGLEVIPGLSDYPYIQMRDNCLTTRFNCYTQVKEQYTLMLKNGFLSDDGLYHPALNRIIVMNEPDLKVPPQPAGSPRKSALFCRMLISAIDAMLDAERELEVTGSLPNFTATFSFGLCDTCKSFGSRPALGQMLELRDAMHNPQAYGYHPRNNLAAIYKARVSNSFNTANPADQIRPLFLNDYEREFPQVPVFIGEYHKPGIDQGQDVKAILDVVDSSPVLDGVSFFEFQVRTDKGGSEEDFGMFGLGDLNLGTVILGDRSYGIWCLKPVRDEITGEYMAKEVADAFGGPGPDYDGLCLPNPARVPLNETGFREVLLRPSVERMVAFAGRVIGHMGGSVLETSRLLEFASRYILPGSRQNFAALAAELGDHPGWIAWDPAAACTADRTMDLDSVASAVSFACGKLGPSSLSSFDCSALPEQCQGDVWRTADYVFSVYYEDLVASQGPLVGCNLGGVAAFAPSGVYRQADAECVVTKDPGTTPITQEGYRRILALSDQLSVAQFIRRVVSGMNMQVADDAGLLKLSQSPPQTLREVEAAVSTASWACGGNSGRICGPRRSDSLWWWPYAAAIGGIVITVAMVGGAIGACVGKRWRRRHEQAMDEALGLTPLHLARQPAPAA